MRRVSIFKILKRVINLEKLFIESLKKFGLEINENQLKQFEQYKNLLIEWNEKINLTRIIEPEKIYIEHFLDSLTVLNYCDKNVKSIIDIGTGAGFPGIPLKILNPDFNVTLVDSTNKKVNFLNEVINELGLENIRAIHGRAEEMSREKIHRERYDLCVSRAVANLKVLSELCIPFVKKDDPTGQFICLKGPKIHEELGDAENIIPILGGKLKSVNNLSLPNSHDNYYVVIIDKIKNTPEKYPRAMKTILNSSN